MNKKEREFINVVWQFYHKHGRHSLPWRHKLSPYKVLVSELMLQQTQVDRVIPKYQAFIKQFSTIDSLARAPLADVLMAWQGLGYNRRAKFLHATAQIVMTEHGGKLPRSLKALQSLPGIGPYTAAAVMVYAYNQPVPFIETNVRQVYIHHFFAKRNKVGDSEILVLVEKTIAKDNPRDWFAAIMDYGSHLKQQYGNVNARSAKYIKQSKFVGSSRQVRGAILRQLSKQQFQTEKQLYTQLSYCDTSMLPTQLRNLATEGLISIKKGKYRLGSVT